MIVITRSWWVVVSEIVVLVVSSTGGTTVGGRACHVPYSVDHGHVGRLDRREEPLLEVGEDGLVLDGVDELLVGGQVGLGRLLPLGHQDHVEPELGLDRLVVHLADGGNHDRFGERHHIGVGSGAAEGAFGGATAGVGGQLGGERPELLTLVETGEDIVGLRLGRHQDVGSAHIRQRRGGLLAGDIDLLGSRLGGLFLEDLRGSRCR